MPVTPLHFGVGMLAKGLFPRRASLAAFVISQVVIDTEVAYYMLLRHEWPVHRWAHTVLGGLLIGLASAAGVVMGGWALLHLAGRRWAVPNLSEASWLPALVGGLLGGLTHPVLDGVMHEDVTPFRPFSDKNPFLNVIGVQTLHLALVVVAMLGAILLVLWASRLAHRVEAGSE
jgi:membrane-bound metal-dependent hydrolase YbcI (DUF457 family)